VEILNNVLKSHPTVVKNETEEEKTKRLTKTRERDRAGSAVVVFSREILMNLSKRSYISNPVARH